ncbi:unnamed protein product [Tuber aestivum]|uniref:SUN domain-containing protein n=1 Tax=Tuber aestivum TaxID=59557 RepID=A0A292Q1H7_9PEZI|nr:unnamed protein product [Tuber aestivum]
MELCDDILVDTVVLANFEFFSSMLRSLKISDRDGYPIEMAGRIKEFSAGAGLPDREGYLMWVRYRHLKVELLTQYGNELYCLVSLLWGDETSMMEEFKHLGKISVGWAEEGIIEKVAPEGVAVNIEKVQARVTAVTLAVEEAMPKKVCAVNEPPVREIRIQRYHGVLAVSKPVLVLEVEPPFSADLQSHAYALYDAFHSHLNHSEVVHCHFR